MVEFETDLSVLLNHVDAPARAVLDKTERNKRMRIADETQHELDKVMKRVNHIYGAYENSAKNPSQQTNVEYVADLAELEVIMQDDLKKRRYLHQVTVFIVGYEKVANSRLQIIQQVSEFLTSNETLFDTDLARSSALDTNEGEESLLAVHMEESIESCQRMVEHLAEINQEMVQYLVKNSTAKVGNKGKRKIEKSLETAKVEMQLLGEKLTTATNEIMEKEDKIEQLIRHLEHKEEESTKYKLAAEAIKKSLSSMEDQSDQIHQRDVQIRQLKNELSTLKIDFATVETGEEMSRSALREMEAQTQKRIKELEDQLNFQHVTMENEKKDLNRQLTNEVAKLEEIHRKKIEEINLSYASKLQGLEHQASRAGIKEGEEAEGLKWIGDDNDPNKPRGNSRVASSIMGSRLHQRSNRNGPDSRDGTSVASEEEKPVVNKFVQTVDEEDVLTFNDTFDLDDEDAWVNLTKTHLAGRFSQYRQLSRVERNRLEECISEVKTGVQAKLALVKTQYQEHQARWNKEKETLLMSVEQAEEHRSEAQKIAEEAVAQIEAMVASSQDPEEKKEIQVKTKISILEAQNAVLQSRLDEALTKLERFEKQEAEKNESIINDIDKDEFKDIPFGPDKGKQKIPEKNISEETTDSAKEVHIADHPVVQEYLTTYDHLMNFRHKLTTMLLEKNIRSPAADILTSFKAVVFQRDSRVTPQVQQMRRSVTIVLDQSIALIQHILKALGKDWSSSRTGSHTGRFSGVTGRGLSTKDDAEHLKVEFKELKVNYEDLKFQFETSTKKYETQIKQSTTLMLEMQATIEQLRQEVNALHQNPSAMMQTTTPFQQSLDSQDPPPQATESQPTTSSPPMVYFTRLNAERNAAMLKRAFTEHRIDRFAYEDALEKMEEYTQIPLHRLVFLVKKYMHNQTMKRIADYVRKNRTLNSAVFKLLDKMEYITEQRDRRYATLMDMFSQERICRAQAMIETFDGIEDRCSIFLIRPVASLQARKSVKQICSEIMHHHSKHSGTQSQSQDPQISHQGSAADLLDRQPNFHMSPIHGAGIRDPLVDQQPTTYWNPMISQSTERHPEEASWVNTPKLLEMDVNRFLISQNNVSSRFPVAWRPVDSDSSGFVHSRYPMTAAPPPHMSVRTYVSVSRPATQSKTSPSPDKDKIGPLVSVPAAKEPNKVPPTTPLNVRSESSAEYNYGQPRSSRDLTGQPPLPPITADEG